LVPGLISSGYNVWCFDRVYSPRDNFFHGDVRCESQILRLLDLVDYVIPLAGLVGFPICKAFPIEAEQVNFKAISFLMSCLGDKKVIFPNTNSGYGNNQNGELITEEEDLTPVSIYGQTKVKAEEVVRKHENHIVFRLATIFGVSTKMRDDLMVNHFTKIASCGEKLKLYEPDYMRNFIYIGDVVRLFIFAIENFESMKGNVFNAGLDNANMTKIELCELIESKIPGFKYDIVQGTDPDQRNYMVSNKKLMETGFKCNTTLESGIEQLNTYWKMCI
jgi:nucleoside-diphosphate-sugar epimerase